MSKYIVEHKKPNYKIFAWLSALLMTFNVFHPNLLLILFKMSSVTFNLYMLALSLIFLFLYAYFEKKLNPDMLNFNIIEFIMIATFFVVVGTSVLNFANNFSYIVRYASLIIVIFFMKNDAELVKIVFYSLMIVMMLHLGATLFFYFDKNFYIANILPTFQYAQRTHLYYQVMINNFATGLANNFSLNGMYMSITSVLAFAYMHKNKITFKSFMFFAISMTALFMTGKRGALLFTVFALLLTYMITNKESFLYKLGLLIPIGLLICISLYIISFYVEGVSATLERTFNNADSDVSNGRFKLYGIAWGMFVENPIFGIGWREYADQVSVLYYGDGYFRDAHNVFLQLLAETGIFGFTIFLTLFSLVIIRTINFILMSKKDETILPKTIWMLLVFSLCFQVYFLGYCMTGNPLYDISTMYAYFFCVGFTSYVDANYKEKLEAIFEKPKVVSKYIRRP